MAGKKKLIYETHEERLINGDVMRDYEENFSLIRELFSRVRVCEIEILRLQNVILSVSEDESIRVMKERLIRKKNT